MPPIDVAAAFTLTHVGDGAVNFTATAQVIGGASVVTLGGFSSAEASQGGSLNDGSYALTVVPAGAEQPIHQPAHRLQPGIRRGRGQ